MAGGSNKKIANSLVALSSAAVLTVYAAGYSRTRSAAAKFETQTEERRPAPAAPPPPVAENTAAASETPVDPPPANVSKQDRPKAKPVLVASGTTPSEPAPKPVAETPAAAEPAPVAVVEAAPAPPPPAPPTPPPAPEKPPAPVWKDGTYTGWGTSRHGDIQAAVVVDGGKIASATIAQCLTRYSCDVISRLPPQVAQRQSPEVDYVSGATQSTNAFYYAVVDALNKAK